MLMTKDEINDLIINNQKLAYEIVHRYREKVKAFIEYEDLKSIALLGLVKAANTFDSSKGNTFSTYAFRVIENQILMQIRKDTKLNKICSLENLVQDGEKIRYEDLIEDDYNLEESFIENESLQLLRKFRKELPPNLEAIIQLTLLGMTQEEIAKVARISQPQVSRLYHQALRIFRRKFEKYK